MEKNMSSRSDWWTSVLVFVFYAFMVALALNSLVKAYEYVSSIDLSGCPSDSCRADSITGFGQWAAPKIER
jgi:hypothetical protein